MELRELLAGADVAEIAGDEDVEITGLAYDSRRVEPGICSSASAGNARMVTTSPSGRSGPAPLPWSSSEHWSFR